MVEFLKNFLTMWIVKPFKRFPYFGRFRFWCLYLAYRLTGWHIRHKEWDFILEYLPKLMKGQEVQVLDFGAGRNLLGFEILGRGYLYSGIDLEGGYDGLDIIKGDMRKTTWNQVADFVICVSVIEHVEGDFGQSDSIKNMVYSLKPGGRLLLTCPTHEFAQGHPWHGFNLKEIEDMLPSNAVIYEYTERVGQICVCIGKNA